MIDETLLQPNYYATIPAPVMYDKRINSSAKLLYGQISSLTFQQGYCYASNTYLAALNRIDERTISRLVSQLVDCGHLLLKIDQHHQIKRRLYLKESSRQIDTPVRELTTKMSWPHDKNVVASLASTPSGENARNNKDNNKVLSTKVERVKRPPVYGNSDINLILATYKAHMGHDPTDKQPRRAAHNMQQSLYKLQRDLKNTAFTGEFPDMVERCFKWYMEKYPDMPGETISTLYRKVKYLLIPATLKKYDVPQRVSVYKESRQEVRGHTV